MVHNNPKNALDGARLKAAGMIAGVGDMCYLREGKTPLFLEFKTPTGKQSKKQIWFEGVCKKIGVGYEIVRSFEEFKEILQK